MIMDFSIILCFFMKKYNLVFVYFVNSYIFFLFIVLCENYVENIGKGRKYSFFIWRFYNYVGKKERIYVKLLDNCFWW